MIKEINGDKQKLIDFLDYVEKYCNDDYGTAAIGVGLAGAATSRYFSNKFGITGFQAGCVRWEFLRNWMYSNNKLGLQIINYDELLSQFGEDKIIPSVSKAQWEKLQELAKERKNEEGFEGYSESYKDHINLIINGKIPFGLKLKED